MPELYFDFVRRPLLTTFSILGLSLGCTLLALLLGVLSADAKIDRQHPNSDQLFRLETTFHLPGGEALASARAPLAAIEPLIKYFPGEIESASVLQRVVTSASSEDKEARISIFFHDTNFQKLLSPYEAGFDLKLSPGEAIISKEVAEKLFPNEVAIGKKLVFQNGRGLIIADVMDAVDSTHFEFDALTTIEGDWYLDFEGDRENWYDTTSYVYLKMASTNAADTVEKGLAGFVKASAPTIPGAPFTPEEFIDLSLRPITEVHYEVGLPDDLRTTVDKELLFYLQIVAFVVMLIVVLNHFNSSTVNEYANFRVYDVKYLMGASHREIVSERIIVSGQIILIVSSISIFLLYLVQNFQKNFIDWTGVSIEPSNESLLLIFAFLSIIVMGTTVILATVITHRGITSLSTQKYRTVAPPIVGRVTLFFQTMITSTLLYVGSGMYTQTMFMMDANHGYSSADRYFVSINDRGVEGSEVDLFTNFRNRLLVAGADSASFSSWIPFDQERIIGDFTHQGMESADDVLISNIIYIDSAFFKTWNIDILIGSENLESFELPADGVENFKGSQIIVNETLVRRLGLTNASDAIGYRLSGSSEQDPTEYQIVGVSKDFTLGRIDEPVGALIMRLVKGPHRHLVLHLSPALSEKQFLNEHLAAGGDGNIKIVKLSDRIADTYRASTDISIVIFVTTLCAMLFAVLGLVTLGSHETIRMKPMFAIMIAFGGDFGTNLYLYLKTTTWPILLSSGISIFIGYSFLSGWLDRYDMLPGNIFSVPLLAVAVFLSLVVIILFAHYYISCRVIDTKYLAEE